MSLAIRRFLLLNILGVIVFIALILYGSRLYGSTFINSSDMPWIVHLARQSVFQNSFTYPVNEINIDLSQNMSKSKVYALSVYIPDLYHLFCLKEVLKQQKIKYYLKNQGNNVKLLVYLSNKQNIKLLLKLLKTHNLYIKVLSNQEEK